MDQSSGLLSGVCGLGIVCSGLLLVVVVLVIRFTGRGLLPILTMLLNRRAERKPVDVPIPRRRVDLRARAQSADFDSALAAASVNDPTTPAPPAAPLSAMPPTTTLPLAAPDRPWLNGRRRPRNEDEIFGGLLDSDGDGEVDL